MIANLPNQQHGWRTMQLAREPDRLRQQLLKTRYTTIGVLLVLALFAFEVFNFDTTQFALRDLMGGVQFAGVQWATILAIAFCGIDFAGLLRLFTPDEGDQTPTEVWYLMAAWLLGATMNAVMTWYAMSLTLLQHHVGNAILSEAQLLQFVPLFVAFLVWLTRILFIGALTVAGNRVLEGDGDRERQQVKVRVAPQGYRSHRPNPIADDTNTNDEPIQFVPPSHAQHELPSNRF